MAQPDQDRRGQTFRLDRQWTAAGIPAAVALGFFVWAALDPRPVRGLIADCVVGVVLVALAQRAWASKITVDRDGVRVTGLIRTRFVPWSEIERFEVGASSPLLAVRVIRRDDKPLGTLNLGAGGFQRELRRSELQLIADRLNAILDERRAGR